MLFPMKLVFEEGFGCIENNKLIPNWNGLPGRAHALYGACSLYAD